MLEGFYIDCPSGGSYEYWWDHLADQTTTFVDDGFTAIWLPCGLKGASGGYSSGYDPWDDYDLGDKNQEGTIATHYGNRQQLERLCAMIHANGMQPYEDIVNSHRDGDSGNYAFQYPNYYGTANAGRFPKSASDFYPNVPMESNTPDTTDTPDGRWIMPVTGGQTEINGQEWVWSDYGMKQSGVWMTNALDIDGYRVDDVRAMSWTWLYSWLNYGSMSGKYTVGENWDGSVSDLETWVETDMENRSSAFDFPLKFNYLNPMCNSPSSFNMASLVGSGFVAQDPAGAVTFAENHDTDSSNPITQNKLLAYAYILTNQGYPCVYYRDWSTDSGSYGSGLQAGINNLMWINNFIASGNTQQRWENGSIYVYERTGGHHLLTGLNTASTAQQITCATGFGANVWLHDYTGHESDVETDGSGNATITIPALSGSGSGYCCYSVESISGSFGPTQNSTTQEYDGAIDLDVPPADNTKFVPVGTIDVAGGKQASAAFDFNTASWTSSTYITLRLLNAAGTVVTSKNYYNTTAQGTTLAYTPSSTGRYEYQVESFNLPSGVTLPSYSVIVTYTAPESGGTAPTTLAATGSSGQAKLTWSAASGASSYNIYMGSTSYGGETPIPVATGVTTTSYTKTGLTNGTQYYFEVAAVNSSGLSSMSNETTATP